MANLSAISFNAGETTPQIDARSDIEKYANSCRILENLLPTIYGAVTRRPGTKYIVTAKNTSEDITTVPFIFNSTTAYTCEFGDLYIRFILNGAQLLDGSGNVVEVTTTYLKADLPQLQFEQIGDVMWITHGSYASRKLTRTSATSFSLDAITFDKGPFLIRNDIENNDDITMTPTGLDIATITTGAAGAALFTITFATTALATAAVALFPANQRFFIGGSTSGDIDAAYTVDAARATTSSTVTLTVRTTEAIASDPADNGDVYVDGGTGTLTASSATFVTGDDGHADALFKLTQSRVQTVTSGSGASTGTVGEAISVKGPFTFKAFGTWTATVELQRNEDGTNWETFRPFIGNNDQQIRFNTSEPDDNVQYRMNITAYTSGTIQLSITVNTSTQSSIARISSVTNTTTAAVTWVVPPPSSVATKRWAEGAWSAVQGYPSSVGAIEGRITYGGTSGLAQTLWLSESDQYEDFEEGLGDSDSFSLILTTTNTIRWLRAIETLIVGTSGDEWVVQSSKIDTPLTPTDFSAKQQSQYGSAAFQPEKAGTALLFVDFVGRRLREFIFDDAITGKYKAPDLNALAEHITEDVIIGTAFQRNPDPILWAWTTNGTLLSMTYEREQDVIAWARHPLGGNGAVLSVSVIPSSTEDEVVLAVKRTIDSSTVVYIEQMQPRDWGSDDADAFFVDAGITDTSGSATITGLGHLEGETVNVYLDGAVMDTEKVLNAQITMDESGVKAQVGLPNRYTLKPMRFDVSGQGGTSKGSIKKIREIVVSFFESRDAQYGPSLTELSDFDGWRSNEPYDSPPDLFTGDKVETFEGGFDREDPILISGNGPSPCTIRAIIARTEISGR